MVIAPGQPLIAFDAAGIARAPTQSGVYALCSADGSYVYFGHAENLHQRLVEQLMDQSSCMQRAGAVFFAFETHASNSARVSRHLQLMLKYPTPCNQAVVAG
jgi:hypothetical protein